MKSVATITNLKRYEHKKKNTQQMKLYENKKQIYIYMYVRFSLHPSVTTTSTYNWSHIIIRLLPSFNLISLPFFSICLRRNETIFYIFSFFISICASCGYDYGMRFVVALISSIGNDGIQLSTFWRNIYVYL